MHRQPRKTLPTPGSPRGGTAALPAPRGKAGIGVGGGGPSPGLAGWGGGEIGRRGTTLTRSRPRQSALRSAPGVPPQHLNPWNGAGGAQIRLDQSAFPLL